MWAVTNGLTFGATLCNHLFAFQAIDRDKGKKGKKGKGKKKGGKKKGGKKGKKMKDLTPDRYRIFLQNVITKRKVFVTFFNLASGLRDIINLSSVYL